MTKLKNVASWTVALAAVCRVDAFGALSGLQADASRAQRSARQEYDRTVTRVLDTGDIEAKKRLAAVIDQLYELGGELPPRINENRRPPGANQISKGGTAV